LGFAAHVKLLAKSLPEWLCSPVVYYQTARSVLQAEMRKLAESCFLYLFTPCEVSLWTFEEIKWNSALRTALAGKWIIENSFCHVTLQICVPIALAQENTKGDGIKTQSWQEIDY
jgi:hypothetical protein